MSIPFYKNSRWEVRRFPPAPSHREFLVRAPSLRTMPGAPCGNRTHLSRLKVCCTATMPKGRCGLPYTYLDFCLYTLVSTHDNYYGKYRHKVAALPLSYEGEKTN